jgi:hypothetical protein
VRRVPKVLEVLVLAVPRVLEVRAPRYRDRRDPLHRRELLHPPLILSVKMMCGRR